MFLSKDQFVGYYTIDFSDIADDFSDYAEQTEKKVLTDAFGKAMYDDMVANPTDAKYVTLFTDYDLDDMLRNFFYFYYLRDRNSYSSTLGEFESEAQNATRSIPSRNRKITTAYNDALELYWKAAEYVHDNTDTYTLYSETLLLTRTNVWGIQSVYPKVLIYPDDWFIRGYPI